MLNSEFETMFDSTVLLCKDLMMEKERFYGRNEDRLEQFKKIAVLIKKNPELSAYALVSKHFTALGDMLEAPSNFSMEQFDAYLMDIIIYSVLIRALLLERKGLDS